MEKKEPWDMPTPPADIQKIVDKLDNNQDLTEAEGHALDQWEDSQGGFGGISELSQHGNL